MFWQFVYTSSNGCEKGKIAPVYLTVEGSVIHCPFCKRVVLIDKTFNLPPRRGAICRCGARGSVY